MIHIQSFVLTMYFGSLGMPDFKTSPPPPRSCLALGRMGWLTGGMTPRSSPRSWTAYWTATTTDWDPDWEVSQSVCQPVSKTQFPSRRLCPIVTGSVCPSPSPSHPVSVLVTQFQSQSPSFRPSHPAPVPQWCSLSPAWPSRQNQF